MQAKFFTITVIAVLMACFAANTSHAQVELVLPNAPVVVGDDNPKPATNADGFVTDYEPTASRSPEKKIGSPRVVKKEPIFDNAPFLHLKRGDQLVKGRRWFPEHKGVAGHFVDNDSYFLSSGGKFYDLNSYGIYAKFDLSSLTYLRYFDWNFTLPNATKLYKIHLQSAGFLLTPQQYKSLRQSLRKDFSAYLSNVAQPILRQPHLEGSRKNNYAVFEYLAFEIYTNQVFHYRVLIGPGLYIIKRRALIKGPRAVQRDEFEGPYAAINGPIPPDKATANRARAAYIKSQAFRRVVASVLPEPKRSELQHRDQKGYY